MAVWFNSTSIIVDDTDPSISYFPAGAWDTDTGISEENDYNDTLTSAGEPGFSATFQFTGIGIEVFGTVGGFPTNGFSSYSIDGGPATSFFTSTATPQTLFFNSPPLDAGDHTLRITTSGIQFVYALDYIIYTPGSIDRITKRAFPINNERTLTLDGGGRRWSKDAMAGSFLGGALCMFVTFLLLTHVIRRRRDKRLV